MTFSQWEIRFVSLIFSPWTQTDTRTHQNRWDIDTVKRVAVEVVNSTVNGEGGAAQFLAVEAVDELTGDRRVVLERQNALPLVEYEVSVSESPVTFTLLNHLSWSLLGR